MNETQLVVECLSRQRYEALLPQMRQLFGAAFGRDIDARLLQWRYLGNPVDDLLDFVARLADGSLAASYSASPVVLELAGQTVRSALSMTTMTAPAFAGRGLFTRLAVMLYEHMQAHGYDLVWGFPNANSHHGFISKLQWCDIYEIPTMSLDLQQTKAPRLPLPGDQVRMDPELELDYTGVAAGESRHLMVRRSREYLRWRYLQHPENEYSFYCTARGTKVSSYCITKVYQGSALDIVDLMAASRDEMALLLGKVLEAARAAGVKRIDCWAPRHHFCHSVYEKSGFALAAPITYLGARALTNARISASDLRDYSNWYLQMGDSDVY